MNAPTTAMVLAAGLGTRMRPLTLTRPKALVEVGGRALIDRVLDRLAQAGVTKAVVNVHHMADMMEDHLKRRRDMEVLVSDERDRLLDSGGGIQKARPLLGHGPVFLANIDSLWTEGARPAMETLKAAWDPERMDLLLLLAPRERTLGFDGPEGFLLDESGKLTHSTDPAVMAPYANVGFGVFDPAALDDQPKDGAFSIYPTWKRLQAEGRFHGAVMDGFWMHVGDPAAREAAEARIGAERS